MLCSCECTSLRLVRIVLDGSGLRFVFSDTNSSFPCSALRLLVSRNCTNRCVYQTNCSDVAIRTEHIGLLFLEGGKKKKKN